MLFDLNQNERGVRLEGMRADGEERAEGEGRAGTRGERPSPELTYLPSTSST